VRSPVGCLAARGIFPGCGHNVLYLTVEHDSLSLQRLLNHHATWRNQQAEKEGKTDSSSLIKKSTQQNCVCTLTPSVPACPRRRNPGCGRDSASSFRRASELLELSDGVHRGGIVVED